jgi:phytoene desaturase
MVIDRYATYSGSDPRRAPAALAVVPHVETAYGAWYVGGGLRRIADAVADRARFLGAEIVTGVAVDRVREAGGRVTGVVAGDRSFPADVVVSDVDAAVLYRRLLPRPAVVRRLSRAAPSLSGFVLLLGLRGRTPGLHHHTVSFPGDYDAEFDAVFATGRVRRAAPVDDPTLYFSVPRDATTAPRGDESWFVLVNAPRDGDEADRATVDWSAPGRAERYAERLLDVMAARGYDVRDRIAVCEHRSPADLAAATGSPGGAIYGTSSNGATAAFLRPANRSPTGGLFLVGGSAHPGGGLPLVLHSAAITARLIGPA